MLRMWVSIFSLKRRVRSRKFSGHKVIVKHLTFSNICHIQHHRGLLACQAFIHIDEVKHLRFRRRTKKCTGMAAMILAWNKCSDPVTPSLLEGRCYFHMKNQCKEKWNHRLYYLTIIWLKLSTHTEPSISTELEKMGSFFALQTKITAHIIHNVKFIIKLTMIRSDHQMIYPSKPGLLPHIARWGYELFPDLCAWQKPGKS